MENQLKATELRIGNLVKYKLSNIPQEIKSLISHEDGYYVNFRTSSFGNSIDKIEPIQITEDILVKLGFEKFSSTPYWLNYKNEKGFGISQWLSKEPVVGFEKTASWYHGDDFMEIKSVHHLQNYYHAKTGEELTFKN